MSEKTIDLFAGCENPSQEQQEQYNCFIERFGKEPPVHFTYREILHDRTTTKVNKWYIASDKLQVVLFTLNGTDTVCIDLFTFDTKEEFIKHIDVHKDRIVFDATENFSNSALFTIWDPMDNEVPSAFMEIIFAAKEFEIW